MNSRRISPAATRQLPAATRQLLAAMRRQDVAMGASPWTSSPQLAFSPEGTTGASFHSAPLGLRTGRLPCFHGLAFNHGLAPMATTCRPVGTQYRIRCSESAKLEHDIKANLNGLGYGG